MGNFDAPVWGEGVEIPGFSTDLMRALQLFWTSILVNRSTRASVGRPECRDQLQAGDSSALAMGPAGPFGEHAEFCDSVRAQMRSAETDSVLRVLRPLIPRRGARLRVALAAILLLGLAGFFVWFVHPFYPLHHWLFFYYARAWLFAGFFLLASLAGGLRILGYILPESLHLGERLILGWALGVLAFFWGVFGGGLAGLFGSGCFFGWPGLLLLLGGTRAVRTAQRAWVHLGRRFGPRVFLPRNLIEVSAGILLVLSLAAIYLQVMTPANLGADANSYHIPLAEHYVAAGKIERFADGWYAAAYPHLTSVLYTWAFQAPGDYADRVALCSHLEWALLFPTLAGVAVLAGQLTRKIRLPFAGAAVFLFPGIYLYDSSLITGADHVLAFWAPPLALALLRLGRSFSSSNAVLAGTLSAAPMLTKLTGVYLFIPAAMLVVILAVRARRIQPLLAWGLCALLASTAYWLKNWVFYANPMYPLLHGYFSSQPWHEGAGDLLRTALPSEFTLTGTPQEKLLKTLKTLVTFSFVPNDWGGFHGEKPVFGSLFTLLIPVLLFLRAPRRLWVLVVGTHLGVAIWYLTNHQDRYLQALVPWMAASVAAGLALAWRHGPFVRIGAVALVGAQLVWGMDVYFFRTHAMLHDSPIRGAGELLGAAHQQRYQERFERPGTLLEIGDLLPPGAKLLVHAVEQKLGARAETVLDSPGRQGAIEYLELVSPRAVEALWREMGVTHAVWIPTWGVGGDDLAREAVFDRTLYQLTDTFQDRSHWRMAKLNGVPRDATDAAEPTRIAWLDCRGGLPLGIYSPRGFSAQSADVLLAETALQGAPLDTLASANAVILERNCAQLGPSFAALPAEFTAVTHPGQHEVWVRTRAHRS